MRFSLVAVSFLVSLAIAAPVPEPHHTEAQIAAKAAKAGTASTTPATVATVKAKNASTKTKTSTAAATATPAVVATAKTASTGSTVKAAAGASVLAASTYNNVQISSGTAGTAETQANALFANIDTNNLAGVSAADLTVIKGIHTAAENAEVSAFNPAIAAASGAAATALQNGKIKNKVLKLTAEVLGIQVSAAQGGSSSNLAAEQAKLANNIKLDTAAAGQASTAVPFTATT